jgi:hypothetical protein
MLNTLGDEGVELPPLSVNAQQQSSVTAARMLLQFVESSKQDAAASGAIRHAEDGNSFRGMTV